MIHVIKVSEPHEDMLDTLNKSTLWWKLQTPGMEIFYAQLKKKENCQCVAVEMDIEVKREVLIKTVRLENTEGDG